GAERTIIRRNNLVAEQQTRLMRRGPLDHAGYERPALIVGLGEDANPGIGHVAVRKEMLKPAALNGARENVGELVIGRIVRRVIARVGGAERRKHRIDDAGELIPRARRLGLRAVALAHRLPVEPIQARVVEAVAHELPHLVESGAIRFGRSLTAYLDLRLSGR